MADDSNMKKVPIKDKIIGIVNKGRKDLFLIKRRLIIYINLEFRIQNLELNYEL